MVLSGALLYVLSVFNPVFNILDKGIAARFVGQQYLDMSPFKWNVLNHQLLNLSLDSFFKNFNLHIKLRRIRPVNHMLPVIPLSRKYLYSGRQVCPTGNILKWRDHAPDTRP